MDVLKITLGEDYLVEKNHLLLPRLKYTTNAYKELSETEGQAKTTLLHNIERKKYTFQRLLSLCGGREDVIVAHKDRYGIPMRLVVSKNSGLMRIDPYFDERSLSLFYQNEYRDLYSSGTGVVQYFNNQVKRGQEIYDYLNSYRLVKENARIAEIGCGAGGILYYFQQRGCACYGCDYGSAYIEFGKTKGVNNLYEGGFETLVGKAQADIVILSHVLEHIVDPVHFLSEIKSKILSDTGVIFIAVPGMLYNHPGYDNVLSLLCQAHVYYFTLATLDFVCGKAGFERMQGNEKVQGIYRKNESVNIKADPRHYIAIQEFILEKDKAWESKAGSAGAGTRKKKGILSRLQNYWRKLSAH